MPESWRGMFLQRCINKKQEIRVDFSFAGPRKIKGIKRTRGDRLKAKECDLKKCELLTTVEMLHFFRKHIQI